MQDRESKAVIKYAYAGRSDCMTIGGNVICFFSGVELK